MAKKTNEVVPKETINKKEILEEIDLEIEKRKDELLNTLDERVDKEVEISVSKKIKDFEKRINKLKNGKIIRRDIIIVLLLALLGYFGYCLYKVDYFHIRVNGEEKAVDVNNNQENQPVEEKLDSGYYIKNYDFLVDNLQINDDALLELYNSNYTKDNIPNSLKLKIAYKNLKQKLITEENNMITFNSSDLLESAQEIFGQDTFLNNEFFTYNNMRFMYFQDAYIAYKEEPKVNNVMYQVIDASEVDGVISFDLIVAKLENNQLLDLAGNIIVEVYNQEDLKTYQSQASKVKVSFEKEEDNYIFSRIEKLF